MALLYTGEGLSSIIMLSEDSRAATSMFFLSLTSATGQLIIYYTIKEFGAGVSLPRLYASTDNHKTIINNKLTHPLLPALSIYIYIYIYSSPSISFSFLRYTLIVIIILILVSPMSTSGVHHNDDDSTDMLAVHQLHHVWPYHEAASLGCGHIGLHGRRYVTPSLVVVLLL